MKAVHYSSHGGPDVLVYADVADPVPGPGDVVVEVAAATVNRLDLLQRRGPGMLPGFRLPHIAGMDIAGTIVATGSDVAAGRIGERVAVNPALPCGECPWCRRGDDGACNNMRVIGAGRDGGYAERCVVPAGNALTLPADTDLASAATWPTAYSTAWHALFPTARLVLGESVLIHAAASGVSSAAIQLAARAGAFVIATARRDDKLDWARTLGAHAVINSETEDVAEAVRRHTDGLGVDVVLDHVGPALFDTSIRSLRPRGRLVFFGTTTGSTVELSLPAVYRPGLELRGAGNYSAAEFADMIAYLAAARLASIVDRELPLARAADAHRLVESGDVLGKVVLIP